MKVYVAKSKNRTDRTESSKFFWYKEIDSFENYRRVTQTISKYLEDKYIILPTNENYIDQMASNFYNSYGFAKALM